MGDLFFFNIVCSPSSSIEAGAVWGWSTSSSSPNADTFYEPDSWLSESGKGGEKKGATRTWIIHHHEHLWFNRFSPAWKLFLHSPASMIKNISLVLFCFWWGKSHHLPAKNGFRDLWLESAFSDGAKYSAAFPPKMLQLPLMDAVSTQNKINLNSLLFLRRPKLQHNSHAKCDENTRAREQ